MEIVEVPGHSMYGVTEDGLVWSKVRGDWRLLSLSVNGKWGYLKVKLTGCRTFKVHDLIARVFLGERPKGAQINHIDGVKKNNAASNLEYCTRSENVSHAYRLGLVGRPTPKPRIRSMKGEQKALFRSGVQGESHANAKLTVESVRAIRSAHASGRSLRSIATQHAVSANTVHRITRREKWAHID